MDAIILDTETTTNKDTPERALEVIELAWLPYEYPSTLGEGVVRRYKPRTPATFGATAVHHILPQELEGCPPSSSARADLPAADYWIGHNIDFDWKALGSPKVRRICTLALARSLWPDCDSHTLSATMYFLFGANEDIRNRLRNAHSALADCEFVSDILGAVSRITKASSLEALWELSEEARVPKTMTFGKFAGQPISAVDRGYASWYNKQADPDPYIIEAFRRQGLLR